MARKFKSFNYVENEYYNVYHFNLYEIAINGAVKEFRETYSKLGDSRLLTTKKKPVVKFIHPNEIYIEIEFNGCRYGQHYMLLSYFDYGHKKYTYPL